MTHSFAYVLKRSALKSLLTISLTACDEDESSAGTHEVDDASVVLNESDAAAATMATSMGVPELIATEPSITPDAAIEAAAMLEASAPVRADASTELTPFPPAPSNEKTCLTLNPRNGQQVENEHGGECPAQACLPTRVVYTVENGKGVCVSSTDCKVSQVGPDRSETYEFGSEELMATVTFQSEILRGYSTESFRRFLTGAGARVDLPIDGQFGLVELAETRAEIVDYSNQQLHVRIYGLAREYTGTVDVVPWICQTGHLPTICTNVGCMYNVANQGSGKPPEIVIDAKFQIEQPT